MIFTSCPIAFSMSLSPSPEANKKNDYKVYKPSENHTLLLQGHTTFRMVYCNDLISSFALLM